MGILRAFIEKLETSGAVAPSTTDDPEPLTSALAGADAAIQEAIRRRQAVGASAEVDERRDQLVPDRRDQPIVAVSLDRRGAVGDRRSKGPGFGRRTRG